MNFDYLVCINEEHVVVQIKGSQPEVCSRCGSTVLVAPSGLQTLASSPKLKILCAKCAMQDLDDDKVGHVAFNHDPKLDGELELKQPRSKEIN